MPPAARNDRRALHVGHEGGQPLVVEAQPVDQRLRRRQAEHARLGVARLRLGRHGADLDEAEAHRTQAVDAFAVLVQPGGQADAVGETQPGHASPGRRRAAAATGTCAGRVLQPGQAGASSGRGRVPGPGRTGRGGSGRRERAAWRPIVSAARGAPPGRIICAMTQDELKALVGRAALEHVVRGPAGRRGHRLHRQPLHRRAGDDQGPLRRRRVQLAGQHRAAARGTASRCSRRSEVRAPAGLHRRRRRDRPPRLHDQGRRRGAHAREDRRRPGRALRLHRRRDPSSSTCWAATRCRWR